jgi:hypothetical protein
MPTGSVIIEVIAAVSILIDAKSESGSYSMWSQTSAHGHINFVQRFRGVDNLRKLQWIPVSGGAAGVGLEPVTRLSDTCGYHQVNAEPVASAVSFAKFGGASPVPGQ